MKCLPFLALATVVSLPGLVAAQTTCGVCFDDPEKVTSAYRLENEMTEVGIDRVRRLLAVRQLCARNSGLDCGVLSKEEAAAVAAEWRISRSEYWDVLQKIFLAFIASAGLILGVLNRYFPNLGRDV
jgi:hypothetical protein